MTFLILIWEFIKTGLFTIGGGLATMPFLYAMADKYPWFSRELLVDMIAISESSPGPIGINMATYAGYAAAGIPGSIAASLAMVFPSVLIMAGLVRVLDKFKSNRFVNSAFYGLRPAVTALIASAGLGIMTITLIDTAAYPSVIQMVSIKSVILFIVLMTAIQLIKKLQPLHLITIAAVAGVVFQF